MTATTPLALLAAGLVSLGSSFDLGRDDYKLLKGAALKAFEKTNGRSQKGRRIAVELPGGVLDAANVRPWQKSDRWSSFQEKGVDYVFERTNPYVVQAQRKAGARGSPILLLKGSVVPIGKAADPPVAVMVDTVQLLEKPPRRRGPARKGEGDAPSRALDAAAREPASP